MPQTTIESPAADEKNWTIVFWNGIGFRYICPQWDHGFSEHRDGNYYTLTEAKILLAQIHRRWPDPIVYVPNMWIAPKDLVEHLK